MHILITMERPYLSLEEMNRVIGMLQAGVLQMQVAESFHTTLSVISRFLVVCI